MASINQSFLHPESGTVHLLTAVDGWLTERWAVKHHFYDRVILLPSDTIDNWMAVTNSEKASIIAADKAKPVPTQTFIDLWTRCYDCQYDASKEKAFTCNGVALTYQEAIDVYNAPRISYPRPTGLCSYTEISGMPKTMIFVNSAGCFSVQDLGRAFKGNSNLRVARLSADSDSIRASQLIDAFAGCSNLYEIKGIIGVNDINNANSVNAFTNSPNLTKVLIKYLKVSIHFQWQKELSYDSLRYLVDNAANTSPITVTVHPTVYDRLTGDSLGGDIDPGPSIGGDEWGDEVEDDTGLSPLSTSTDTPSDWQQLVTDAAAKNITFATV